MASTPTIRRKKIEDLREVHVCLSNCDVTPTECTQGDESTVHELGHLARGASSHRGFRSRSDERSERASPYVMRQAG